MNDKGIGARLLRKEDDRHLHGRGVFVGDLAFPGMKDVAFVRSPLAHARIRSITKPSGAEDRVFTFDDLTGVKKIRAVSRLPTYKPSEMPVLATGKVRFVGEPIAMCVADGRAAAEDLAQEVAVDLEELSVVADMLGAREPGAPLVHEDWGSNTALETWRDDDIESVAATAPVTVNRELRMARQAMVPMEGTGVVAHFDHRQGQLIVHTSTQVPHLIRSGLAEHLGIEERQVRVIAPDVGGGFGFKCVLQAEEVAVAWLALKCGLPIRYLEDRREHLTAAANAREHHYRLTAYCDRRGRILALDAQVTVDVGAYSVWPFTSCLEAAQAGGNLPGPYAIPVYRVRTYTMATNKPPLSPYRGVARPSVCFAMDVTMDSIARAVGREPWEVRLENLVPASAMPFTNVTKKYFDSGDYPESLRRAVKLIDLDGVRARQRRGEPDGRLLGVGFATYTEQTAHGTSVFAAWGIPLVPGFDQAMARLMPDGGLELRVGVQSHGQGMETTLAQIASEVLGLDPARISVTHGDTGLTPYSTGTYASRSIVMAGGAVSRACKTLAERIAGIGAHLLQAAVSDVAVKDGKVVGPAGSVDFAEIGRVWYKNPEELPADADRGGVEVTAGYRPNPDTGTFAYSSHAVVVAVDPETGSVELLDYVVVEDCGTMVNPMIVDGQTYGGTAQGIGTALYEEVPFDRNAQPLASTFLDYLLPGPTEVPAIRIDHMVSPSPHTEFGIIPYPCAPGRLYIKRRPLIPLSAATVRAASSKPSRSRWLYRKSNSVVYL
ncbi:MAG: xanthine dehydrogenase family protein molybdopterin-binding subunit [Alphaproteobacteria bacterium]